MANVFPTQMGYTPTGANGAQNTSTIYMGRDISVTWECIGAGAQGRPDYLERLILNFTSASGSLVKRGQMTLNVQDLVSTIAAHSSLSSGLFFQFREVQVCADGSPYNMMFIASQPYTTGS